jgi:hypothetical protein
MIRYDVRRTIARELAMPSEKPNLQSASPARPSVEVSTDAVVAAYIHEISERHRRRDPALEPESATASGSR